MNKTDMSAYGLCARYDAASKEYTTGRILSQEKGIYTLISENGENLAEVSGKFLYNAKCPADFPAVGDFVAVTLPDTESRAVIHSVFPRKSAIVRRAAGTDNARQIVAANIDTVFICMSLNNDFNVRRLERYLSVVWDGGANAVIVLTKSDLCHDIEKYKNEVDKVSFGADIIVTTSEDDSCKKLLPYIGFGKTASFIGSSGVGKSTLINRLLGEKRLETNGLRNDDKGRHTTTRRQLFLLDGGGMVIDTPGMRELGLWDADSGLDQSFSDIKKLSEMCRFSDCTHTHEPHCAVLESISNGTLSKERLMSYKKLIAENEYSENADEYTAKKNLKFKDIAKINKNRRK